VNPCLTYGLLLYRMLETGSNLPPPPVCLTNASGLVGGSAACILDTYSRFFAGIAAPNRTPRCAAGHLVTIASQGMCLTLPYDSS
jgi:hypothetical protein